MSDTPLHGFLTSDLLRDALQSAGYRVNQATASDGANVLVSATNGLPFEVRLLNRLPERTETGRPDAEPPTADVAFADAAFRAALRVQGELPLALVNQWNVTHRFARLCLNAPWLLLDMDVVALGGVAPAALRAQVEIWDRLLPELIAWLRVELPKLAKAAPVAEPTEPVEPA